VTIKGGVYHTHPDAYQFLIRLDVPPPVTAPPFCPSPPPRSSYGEARPIALHLKILASQFRRSFQLSYLTRTLLRVNRNSGRAHSHRVTDKDSYHCCSRNVQPRHSTCAPLSCFGVPSISPEPFQHMLHLREKCQCVVAFRSSTTSMRSCLVRMPSGSVLVGSHLHTPSGTIPRVVEVDYGKPWHAGVGDGLNCVSCFYSKVLRANCKG
jgi:hypothetical protein